MPCPDGSWPVDGAPGGEKPSEGGLHGYAGGGMPLTKATTTRRRVVSLALAHAVASKRATGGSNGGGGSKATRCQQALITPIK
jgi:hypothetical protein